MPSFLLFLILMTLLFGSGAVLSGIGWLAFAALVFLLCCLAVVLLKLVLSGVRSVALDIAADMKALGLIVRRRPVVVLEVLFWPIPVGRWVFQRVMTGYEGVFDFVLGATTGFVVWATATSFWLAAVISLAAMLWVV